MVGLGLLSMVSLPYFFIGDRQFLYDEEPQSFYYTEYAHYDHLLEGNVMELQSSKSFAYSSKVSYKESILDSIKSLLESEQISIDVFNNLYAIIDSMAEDIVNNIDLDNIYSSDNGTAIIDFFVDKSIFSLEVGKTKMGYFAEIDDEYVFERDLLEFTPDKTDSLSILYRDLYKFNDQLIVA